MTQNKNCVIFTLKKVAGNDAATTAHIERTIQPKNADPERTHLNRSLLPYPEGVKNRTAAIQHRLTNAGLTRKIGKNQVRAINAILSGSPESMKQIEEQGKLDQWCTNSLEWLQETFGKENIVSAILHMDETTPHIHATIIPIVEGERRKVKEKKKNNQAEPKRKYRKKNPNRPRLCADDVMSRDKLIEYQTSYAEKMILYGLKRGKRGSEAKHITTMEYYRNLSYENERLIENIDHLKRQTEVTRHDLDEVTRQIKAERLKSSALQIASNMTESIGSLFDNSKVRGLEKEKEELTGELEKLKAQMKDQEKAHTVKTAQLQEELSTVKEEISHIYDLAPSVKELLQIEKICKAIRLSVGLIKKLLSGHPVRFKGNLYSPQYKRSFYTDDSLAEIKHTPGEKVKFQLLIDGLTIYDWFRKKNREGHKNTIRKIETNEPKNRLR